MGKKDLVLKSQTSLLLKLEHQKKKDKELVLSIVIPLSLFRRQDLVVSQDGWEVSM